MLILDEPTVGLDPAQIVEIRQMIKGLREKHTVLISTHILPEVAMLCERAIIINQGHVVAETKLDNLDEGGKRLEALFIKVVAADRAAMPVGASA